ncbi:MAG: diguanylate cyclase domain-containing protein [Dissulfurispiraceae bacterium]
MKSYLKCCYVLVVLILCIATDAVYGYDIKIGVLANSGNEKCQKMWTPTAKYLSEKLPGSTFKIVPLSFDNIAAAVRNEEVDFVLANPIIYIDLDLKYGVSRIATLKNNLSDKYPLLGGVIFTRSDNSQIYKLRDLKGKKFVAVAPYSMGGWLAALRELKKGGLDPYKDFGGIQFAGNHDLAIYEVLKGKADAGTANTNEFADLMRTGKFKASDFRVLVPEWIGISKEFPFPVSTRLYPDWPFAKLRRTPEDLATKVAIALLSMEATDKAAHAANCYGWSYPLNYQSVDELSKELRLGAYRDWGEMSFMDILYKYKTTFISAFIIFVILLIVSFILARLYRQTKIAEEKIRHLANHDALTNLPSLRLVKDRILIAMEIAKRNRTLIAVMYVDLDGFKDVNDKYGHEAGDILLKEVGKRLVSSVRKADTVARIGGDEFLMVITELQSPDIAALIAGKILQSMSEPFDLDGKHSTVGASIGISLYPNHGDDVDSLIKQADKAMYAIKHSGKNGYTFVNMEKYSH